MLTELTWRAVASWGYDASFMAGAREAAQERPFFRHFRRACCRQRSSFAIRR